MKHNHNHFCQCEHKQVRFCKHCNTCYCLDCNAEWTSKSFNTWTYPYTYTTGYLQQLGNMQKAVVGDVPTTVGTTTCSHGA